MMKIRNQQAALASALASNLATGLCVFDGFFYVGTVDQLENIGCIDVTDNSAEPASDWTPQEILDHAG